MSARSERDQRCRRGTASGQDTFIGKGGVVRARSGRCGSHARCCRQRFIFLSSPTHTGACEQHLTRTRKRMGRECHAQLARCLVAPRNPAVVKHQPCIPCFGESLAHHGVREAPILAVPAPVPAALHACARQSNRRGTSTVVDFSTPFHAKEGRGWASPTEISHR